MLLTKSNFSGILLSIIYLTKLATVSSSPLLGDMLGASGEEVASREGSVEEGGGGDMTKADNKKGDDGSGNLIINTGASSQGNYPPHYYYPPPPHYHPHYYPYPYPYPPPQPQQVGPFHDTQKFNFQYVKTG